MHRKICTSRLRSPQPDVAPCSCYATLLIATRDEFKPPEHDDGTENFLACPLFYYTLFSTDIYNISNANVRYENPNLQR